MPAYINRIACAVPEHDIHPAFKRFAATQLTTTRDRAIFERMTARAGISSRWSCLVTAQVGNVENCIDAENFYRVNQFPTTATRMQRYEVEAPALAEKAVSRLNLGALNGAITHLIVTSCTGLYAPGLDLDVVQRCRLNTSVERTSIGFMGCNAAVNALKLANHIVRSEPDAKVLVVSLELCSLHLRENAELEQMLSFLLFGDGCAAALVTAEPVGFAIDRFESILVTRARDEIAWRIRDSGFDMQLTGAVPGLIAETLRSDASRIFVETEVDSIEMWAVHPGGRSILDAVESALDLDGRALAVSRMILRDYGNMSSATVLFVLEALMRGAWPPHASGCAMAFGPGLSAETMMFHQAA